MSVWLTGVIVNVRESGKYEYNKIFVIEPRSYDQFVNDTQTVFNTNRKVKNFVVENQHVVINDDLDLAFLNDGAYLVVNFCFEWDISNAMINEYRDGYTSTIDGRNAKSIFSRFSLDNKDLAKIWDLSDRNKDGILDENEYVLARFLIDARLQGEILPDIIPESLLYSIFTPFQLSRSSDSSSMTDFSQFYSSQDISSGRLPEDLKKNKRNSANSQPRNERRTITKAKTTKKTNITIQVVDDDSLWTISKKEKKKYQKLFMKHSRDGYVSGEDAFELFSQSGLNRNVLAKVWSLSDQSKNGSLNKTEFFIALHLIHVVSQNLSSIPDELPTDLWESASVHQLKGHRRQISLDTPPISGNKIANSLSTGMLSSYIKSLGDGPNSTLAYLNDLEISGVTKYPSEVLVKEVVIGKGSFSKVWRGQLNTKKVALKEIHITSNEDLDGWLQEITLMHALSSYNYLVNLIGFSTKDLTLTIIMELCEQGSLYDLIHSQRVQWSMLQKLRTLRHVVKGIQSLHKSNIIHRDLKSLNILVNSKGVAKLSDLGFSIFLT